MKLKLIAAAVSAAALFAGAAQAEGTYFPIIAKGFSHQFWQAVKAGAESKAKELGVSITFEGPETEAQID